MFSTPSQSSAPSSLLSSSSASSSSSPWSGMPMTFVLPPKLGRTSPNYGNMQHRIQEMVGIVRMMMICVCICQFIFICICVLGWERRWGGICICRFLLFRVLFAFCLYLYLYFCICLVICVWICVPGWERRWGGSADQWRRLQHQADSSSGHLAFKEGRGAINSSKFLKIFSLMILNDKVFSAEYIIDCTKENKILPNLSQYRYFD